MRPRTALRETAEWWLGEMRTEIDHPRHDLRPRTEAVVRDLVASACDRISPTVVIAVATVAGVRLPRGGTCLTEEVVEALTDCELRRTGIRPPIVSSPAAGGRAIPLPGRTTR